MIDRKNAFYTVSLLPLPGNSDAATYNISMQKEMLNVKSSFKPDRK